MKARLISVLLVIALLVTVGVVAAQAVTNTTTFDVMNEEAAKTQGEAITVDGDTATGYCAACEKEVSTWTALEAATSADVELTGTSAAPGHYYAAEDLTSNTKSYNVASSQKVHVHLNNKSISSTDNVFSGVSNNSANLYIMGSGTVTSSAAVTISTNGQTYLMGGTYGNTATNGVVVKNISGAHLRRVFICQGVTVNGTVEVAKNGSMYGSLFIYGGTITKVIGPGAYSTNSFVISGEPQIAELTVIGRVPDITDLASGARIGVAAGTTTTGQITGGYTTSAEAEALIYDATEGTGYFYPSNATTHKVVVKTTPEGKYYLALEELEGVAECAACGETAQIIEVAEAPAETALGAGHYKLTADLTLTAPLTVAADVCIDLGAHSVTNESGRVLEITSGTVNVSGTGTVTGAAAEGDAATILVSGGTLNLNGGTFKHTGELPTVYLAGTMTMADGAELTSDEGVTGGNLYIADAGTFTMNGGSITNGTAAYGGNIRNDKGTLNIYAGTISGGHATTAGGNIHIEEDSSKTVIGTSANKGAVNISGGVSDKSGGNIYTVAAVDLTYGAVVEDGEAGTTGGNITIVGGTFRHMNSAVIQNGTAGTHGGNVFINAGELRVSGPSSLIGGEATGTSSTGGNIRVSGGTVNFVSANVTGGTATVGGGMIYIAAGRVNLIAGTYDATTASANDCDGIYLRGGTLNLAGGTITADSSDVTDNRGDAIYVGASDTDTKVIFGEKVQNWSVNKFTIDDEDMDYAFTWNAKDTHSIEVNSAFKGTAYVRLAINNVPSPYYGETVVNGTYTDSGTNGKGHVYLNKGDQPEILSDGNGGLVVAGAQADGAWVATAADAFATATTGIKLYETGATVEIAADTVPVDLNGKSITINGSGVVTATNSKATAASELTLGEGVSLANTEFATWNEDHFDVVLGEEGAYTLHRLEMRIKSISLRPGTAGLYYTSEIVMDDTLKAQVDEVGVVLAVGDGVDGTDYMEYIQGVTDLMDENIKFVGTNEFDSTVNSVLVNNILKTGEDNATRAQWTVHGAAAVSFLNGDCAIAAYENYAQSYSMKDYMLFAESKFAGLSADSQEGLFDFYTKWVDVMSDWGLTQISSFVKTEA